MSIRTSFDNSFVRFLSGGVGELILLDPSLDSRHGIRATLVERMAAAEPFQAQPDAFSSAMNFDRLAHVFRAGGMEAAGRRQQRRNQEFVPTEDCDGDAGGDSLHLLKKRRTSF
jgi:hypothetical protein